MNINGQKYTIQKGDTLTSIAKRFPTSAGQTPKMDTISPAQFNKEKEMAKQNLAAPDPKTAAAAVKSQFGSADELKRDADKAAAARETQANPTVKPMDNPPERMGRMIPPKEVDLSAPTPSVPNPEKPPRMVSGATAAKVVANNTDERKAAAGRREGATQYGTQYENTTPSTPATPVTPGSTVDDPSFTKKSGKTPGYYQTEPGVFGGTTGPDSSKTTPKNMQESFVSVGDYKYRIV